LHDLTSDDIADFAPIQTVSTGLPYAIVPLKRLESLQTLRINDQKMNEYVVKQDPDFGFYYATRDAIDAEVALWFSSAAKTPQRDPTQAARPLGWYVMVSQLRISRST